MDPAIAEALARQGDLEAMTPPPAPRTRPLFGARLLERLTAAARTPGPTTSHSELVEAVAAVPRWWHSIDLGNGVVTPGFKSADYLQQELVSLHLPDLHGLDVLDIGAWDGFYSFTAECLGARRVTALDHFAWSIDWGQFQQVNGWPKDMPASGRPQDHLEAWRPEELPGKAGFDLGHRARASRVEPVVDDFMTMDLARLGVFDVVLFLGVLYHLEDPLGALRRLRRVTDGLAIIETHAIHLPGLEERGFCEFVDRDQINDDPTNWWVPNLTALLGLCATAGFTKTVVVQGPPPGEASSSTYYRAIVHAWT